jgi:hypothetical protein
MPNAAGQMIIDAHTHAWLPADLATLKKGAALFDAGTPVDSPHNFSPRFDGSLENVLAQEDAAGVDRLVLLPVSSRPERCRALTEWVAGLARENPRIIPFGTVHPNSDTLADDVAAVVALGLPGLKLHSLVQFFDPLSESAFQLYALLEKAGLVLLIDSMSLSGAVAAKPSLARYMDIARSGGVETGPRQISRIAESHPGLKIIAAHLGQLYGWHQLDPLYELDQVYFDLAYVHRLLTPNEVLSIIRRKGADRIVFGTDVPYRRPVNVLNWFGKLSLSPEEQGLILAANLIDLLKLDQPGPT